MGNAPLDPEEYLPDFSRRRRVLPRQSSSIGWLLPVAVLIIGLAAVSRLAPDVLQTPATFGRSYVAEHGATLRKRHESLSPDAARAQAESIAVRLRLVRGLEARTAGAGARTVRVRLSDAFNEHQLHLLLEAPHLGAVSVFLEHFGSRTLTLYKRRVIEGTTYYVSSATAAHDERDSVIVWLEPGSLLTLVGRAPEDSLLAFADRVHRGGS